MDGTGRDGSGTDGGTSTGGGEDDDIIAGADFTGPDAPGSRGDAASAIAGFVGATSTGKGAAARGIFGSTAAACGIGVAARLRSGSAGLGGTGMGGETSTGAGDDDEIVAGAAGFTGPAPLGSRSDSAMVSGDFDASA